MVWGVINIAQASSATQHSFTRTRFQHQLAHGRAAQLCTAQHRPQLIAPACPATKNVLPPTCFKFQLAHGHEAELAEVGRMPQHAVGAGREQGMDYKVSRLTLTQAYPSVE